MRTATALNNHKNITIGIIKELRVLMRTATALNNHKKLLLI